MGYSYSMSGHLVCDSCGHSKDEGVGRVTKRRCPFRVTYAEGGSLPYCYPAALCSACYKTNKATLHVGCAEAAAKQTAKEMHRKARREAGELERKACWGDWHETVPEGKVGIMFVGGTMTPNIIHSGTVEEWRLVSKADHDVGGDYLSDYPKAEHWFPHA